MVTGVADLEAVARSEQRAMEAEESLDECQRALTAARAVCARAERRADREAAAAAAASQAQEQVRMACTNTTKLVYSIVPVVLIDVRSVRGR